MLQSLTDSTIKQYATALSRWEDFCIEYDLEFYKPKLDDFQNFLTEAFVEGASYGTINTLRCAVSFISEEKLGEHPAVSRPSERDLQVEALKAQI